MKKKILFIIGGALGAIVSILHICNNEKKMNKMWDQLKKYKCYYDLVVRWMILKQNGISIADYFDKNDLTDIAIYGMGDFGRILYEELDSAKIKIICGIDRNSMNDLKIRVINPSEVKKERIGAIVVTAISDYDSIEKELKGYVKCPIIGLDEIIYSL